VAGAQFPLLIALLGRGRAHVGRDIARATAFNTGGAVLGSLAGGFGLLPLLTAPGCWRLVAGLLLASPRRRGPRPAARPRAPAGPGRDRGRGRRPAGRARPTAAFRHSGIGAGRAKASDLAGPNETEDWLREERRAVVWEAEGRETSVALLGSTASPSP